VPAPAGLALPLVVVLLFGIYVVVPGGLRHGLPLSTEWSTLHRHLAVAVRGIQTLVPPVPPLRGFVLLASWTAGTVAVAADWLAFRLRSPLAAVAPPLVLFVTSAVLGTASERAAMAMLVIVMAAAFLAVYESTVGRRTRLWFGGRRRGSWGWVATAGTGLLSLAALAALLAFPAVSGSDGTGSLGWKTPPGQNGNRITPSPLDQLRTRLLQETNTPVMTVRASVPSYWRLTSLDTYNGYSWQANHSYQTFGATLPGVRPPRRGTRLVVDRFHIQKLNSIWLPAAFDPIAVRGGDRVTWDPVSGSLISGRPTTNGENYTVIAEEQLAQLDPKRLAAAPAAPASILGRYTQLPPLDPRVYALAKAVTKGAATEYAKAYALEQYFHGPQWQYSTDPPSDDDANALVDFLFNLHEGYCQQYAGAYAVLARSLGLPTRIAVGFQEGKRGRGGVYQVTDADAHAWPEVYFGGIGWVPFEPTPGRQVPGATYTGKTGFGAAAPSSSPTAPSTSLVPTSTPRRSRLPAPAPGPASAAAAHIQTHVVRHRSPLPAFPMALLAAVALGVLWVGAVVGGRRWRWRRRRRRARRPEAQVQVAWEETAEVLAWWGATRHLPEALGRHPHETLAEFAGRCASLLKRRLGRSDATAEAVTALAQMAERVAFSPPGAEGADVARARAFAADVRARLWQVAPLRRRLALWADPRLAWRSPGGERRPLAGMSLSPAG
jgi:transglutaminase-like putative cysteine protease